MTTLIVLLGILGLLVVIALVWAAALLILSYTRNAGDVHPAPSNTFRQASVKTGMTAGASAPVPPAAKQTVPTTASQNPTDEAAPSRRALSPPRQQEVERSVAGSVTQPSRRWSFLRRWACLSMAGRIGVVAAPVIVMVGGALTLIVGGARDEGAYQYGRTQESVMARPLWKGTVKVGVEKSRIKTIEDACTRVVDVDRNADTAQGDSMRRMDRDDIIAGCIDVLEDEQKRGYLP